jgi:hypothetical protein
MCIDHRAGDRHDFRNGAAEIGAARHAAGDSVGRLPQLEEVANDNEIYPIVAAPAHLIEEPLKRTRPPEVLLGRPVPIRAPPKAEMQVTYEDDHAWHCRRRWHHEGCSWYRRRRATLRLGGHVGRGERDSRAGSQGE